MLIGCVILCVTGGVTGCDGVYDERVSHLPREGKQPREGNRVY